METTMHGKLITVLDSASVRETLITRGQPLSPKTFAGHLYRGLITPTLRLGGRNFFSREEVERYRLRLDLLGRELSRKRAEAMRQRHAHKREAGS